MTNPLYKPKTLAAEAFKLVGHLFQHSGNNLLVEAKKHLDIN
ncbi:MAG: hypothetical protein WBV73_17490 [Phormidium sp.]